MIAGVKTWKSSPQQLAASTGQSTLQSLHPFRSALTISLLNPKAILFYLSFFVQFVDPNYAYPALSFALLSIILKIISMAYLSILIFSGIKLASYFNRQFKVAAVAVATVGLLFCGFGLKLALSTL